MTPQERAEKTIKQYAHLFSDRAALDMAVAITNEVREAVEEAETKEHMMHGIMVAAFDQRDKAKAEAYEEAAKIADVICRKDRGDETCSCSAREAVKQIRARAAEVRHEH